MYACLLNKPIELYHSTTYFAIFIFPPDFQQRIGDTRLCACYKVYGVDNFSNNSNSYNKESTCPKLTLYLPTVENMVAHILWWLAIIFMAKKFVSPIFQLRNIQYSSKSHRIGVLGEAGLIVAWWCSASTRPSFQSSVAVYNNARWSRITTGFFWIAYSNNGQ